MFYGLHFFAPLAVRVRSHSGFERLIVRPYGTVENLKCSFTSFGGDSWQTYNIIGVGEVPLTWPDCKAIPDSGLVRGSHPYGIIEYLPVLYSVSSAEVDVQIC